MIASLESSRVPKGWKPLWPTTGDEVTLLAPLEIASARGRAKQLFDFDYVWEVYKPVHQRRWGYYTLPVLYGDDLVPHLDPRLDRKTNTLHIFSFWLEEDTGMDADFIAALGLGLLRFSGMAGADKIEVSRIAPSKLKQELKKELAGASPSPRHAGAS